jgi:hypothetical protein
MVAVVVVAERVRLRAVPPAVTEDYSMEYIMVEAVVVALVQTKLQELAEPEVVEKEQGHPEQTARTVAVAVVVVRDKDQDTTHFLLHLADLVL